MVCNTLIDTGPAILARVSLALVSIYQQLVVINK